jgi:hypothetical protein
MTYKIEIQHMDGVWHPAGKLAVYVDGIWIYPEFETRKAAETDVAVHYADCLPGTVRIVRKKSMTNELHKLSELSTTRLRAMLKLITEEPNGDIDLVRLTVRIRAELAARGEE